MALSSIIGRASSPVLPLAIRTVVSLRYFHGDIATAINIHERTILSPKNSFQSHSYSSATSHSPAKKLLDENLIRNINSKMKTLNRVQKLPKGFPFAVESNPAKDEMILKREYADERIEVHFSMANLEDSVCGDDSYRCRSESDDTKHDSEDDSCGETNTDNNKDKKNDSKNNSNGSHKDSSGFHMIVCVIKNNLKEILSFDVVASADNSLIEGMAIQDVNYDERPDILALDEKQKHALHRYLEIRGIKPCMFEYLQKCMINKNRK